MWGQEDGVAREEVRAHAQFDAVCLWEDHLLFARKQPDGHGRRRASRPETVHGRRRLHAVHPDDGRQAV